MKTPEQATAENIYWNDQVQKRAADEYFNDLFDAAFADHTAKLAAADPQYAAILHAEQEKLAFNEAFEATKQACETTAQQAYEATLAQYGRK